MTRDHILTFLRTRKQEMQLSYGVVVIGLFGSYARQVARDDSNIDILVEFQAEKKILRNFLGCTRYLDENLVRNVDLGIETTLKPIARETVRNDVLYA